MPAVEMKCELIRHTLSPEEMVALGAKLCYSGAHVNDLLQRVEAKDQSAFVEKILYSECALGIISLHTAFSRASTASASQRLLYK